MAETKPDEEQIRQFIKELSDKPWLRESERSWWPRFVFHYTAIENAVRILTTGRLLSRKLAGDLKELQFSSGSSVELDSTSDEIKACVRFYFRPKTPTQFYSEGIKTKASLQQCKYPDVHCPVPIFLLFDSANILSRKDSRFSNGSLNTIAPTLYQTASELMNLPWQDIYHHGIPSRGMTSEITHRKNAEVVVYNEVDLKDLKWVRCRSEAEKETLLFLLPYETKEKFRKIITSTSSTLLYYNTRTFIERVILTHSRTQFYFFPDSECPGPFNIDIEFCDDIGNRHRYNDQKYNTSKRELILDTSKIGGEYTVEVHLDRHLAYKNRYEDTSIPF